MMLKMKRKKFTIAALKLWFWVSMGINALLVSLIYSAQRYDIKFAVFGAVVMLAQILHGVKRVFFDKSLCNMFESFCIFQFVLMSLMSLLLIGDLGQKYGMLVFCVCLFEYAVAIVIRLRHKILGTIKNIFLL